METLDRLDILSRLPYVCVGDSMQPVEWHHKNGFHCFKSFNIPGVWVPVCLFKGEWIPVERFSDGPAGFWISEGPINKFVRVQLKGGYWRPLAFFDERPLDTVKAKKNVANVAIKKKTDVRGKRNNRDTKIGSSVPVKPQHIQKNLFSDTKEQINDRRLCRESTGCDFQMHGEKQSVHFPELDSNQAINSTNFVPENWGKKSSVLLPQVNQTSCLNDQLNPMDTESMACEFEPESVKLYDQNEDTEIQSCVQKRMDIQINSNLSLQNQPSVFAQEGEAPNKAKVGKLNPQACAFSPKWYDHQPISESKCQETNYIQANDGSQLHSKLMIIEQKPSSYEVAFGWQAGSDNLNVPDSNVEELPLEPKLGECASPPLAPSPLVKLVVQMYDGKPCYATNMCTLHSYHHKVFQVRRCPVEPIRAPPIPVLDLVQWQIEERLKEKMRQGVNISPADATYMFIS